MLAAWEMGQYRLAPCTVSSLRAQPLGWVFCAMTDELPFKVVRINSIHEVLARAANL